MQIEGEACLLRVFIGESDRHGNLALYEAIVAAARDAGLSGATVLRGIHGYGLTTRLRTTRILDLSTDLPLVVEIVDTRERVDAFLGPLNRLLEEAGSGGLITLEAAHVIRHVPGGAD